MAPFIFWNLAFYTIIRTQLTMPRQRRTFTDRFQETNGPTSREWKIKSSHYK